MRNAFLGLAATMMLVGLAAGDALAQCPDKTIEVINNGRVAIQYLYGSSSRDGDWGEDWLGESQVLRPRQTYTFDFQDGTRQRYYDFKAVFSNGREVTRMNVDVCTESTWNVR